MGIELNETRCRYRALVDNLGGTQRNNTEIFKAGITLQPGNQCALVVDLLGLDLESRTGSDHP